MAIDEKHLQNSFNSKSEHFQTMGIYIQTALRGLWGKGI